MSDAPERRIAPASRRDAAGTIRLTIVSVFLLGTACAYAACVVIVLRGNIDALFGLVPWLAAAALVGCLLVTVSAVAGASRKRVRRRTPRLMSDRVGELAAAIGARESSERERAVERLLKRLDVTRAALGVAANPAIRDQLLDGGFAARVERELETSRSKWHRVNAAGVLGLLGAESSIGPLEQTLADPDVDVAYAAAHALSLYPSATAYGALLDALTGQTIPSGRVAGLLESFRCASARELIERRAEADEPAMRYWGAYLLGSLADPRSAPVIERLARDPNEDVRANAAEALANFRGDELLSSLLADESWVVRSHAAKAAGAGCRTNLSARLSELLEDQSWWVRQNAMIALASFGAAAIPPLLAQLHSPDRFARNKAAEALVRNGYAMEQIERVKEGGLGSRNARRFLIDLGRAEALSTIETAALASGRETRKRMVGVLRAIGTEQAQAVLEALERNGDEHSD
jgi:HEAT repeat protein